jgi:integrase
MRNRKQKGDTRYLMLRGSVWYIKAPMPDGRRLVQSTNTGDLTEARGIRDQLLEPLTLKNEAARIAAVQASLTSVEDRLAEIAESAPALTMLAAWQVFVDTPKGKTGRGRKIAPGQRTLADYEGRWSAFCDWMEATHPNRDKSGKIVPRELRTVTPEQAQSYILEIGRELSPNTRNKTLAFLRLVFNVLGDVAKVKANPFAGMEAAPHSTAKKSNLTLSQLTAISKQLEGAGEMETLFALGFYSGARLGDCVGFKWSDFDIEAGKLTFTPSKTDKGRREIRMTVHPALLRILEKTPPAQRKGVLLPELCELYNRDSSAVCKLIQQVFTDAGIETTEAVKGYSHRVARIGFHSLRHSFITGLIEGGVDMETVRRQAGHSTIGMTAHYFHGEQAAQGAALRLPDLSTPHPSPTPPTTGTAGGLAAFLDGLRTLDADGLRAVITAAKSALKNGGSK